MQTKRFASKSIARCYPFPCMDVLEWEPCSKGFKATIPLSHVEAGQMLIPCLSIPYAMSRFSVQLTDCSSNPHNHWLISPGMAVQHSREDHSSVSTHIDYFHIHQHLEEAILVVEVSSDVRPEDYLLVLALTQASPVHGGVGTVQKNLEVQLDLPARSQMVESRAIRDRICSPTCIQMLLEYHGLLDDKYRLIEDCFDSSVNLYGVWPVNIAAASKRGLIGAIESFSEFKTVCALLEKKVPLVCSIRFDSGQLQNAPLDKTSGHLVILAGLGEHAVRVYDPAASTPETVLRSYAINEFHKAWIDNNGIAYVLVPCGPATHNGA